MLYQEDIGCMGTYEVFDYPLIGTIIKFLQCVPVNRDNKTGKSDAISAIKIRANDESKYPLLIFVQGTTTQGDILTKFKQGAFVPGVPINIVNLNFQKNKHFDLVYGTSKFAWFYRCLTQFQNYLTIEYLGEYQPNEEEKADSTLFSTNVRSYMKQQIKYPIKISFMICQLNCAVNSAILI